MRDGLLLRWVEVSHQSIEQLLDREGARETGVRSVQRAERRPRAGPDDRLRPVAGRPPKLLFARVARFGARVEF